MRALFVCLVLVGLVFSSNSGQVVGDTKLDLSVDPARFLARSLNLWDPTANFGQLQNQAYGYLFPMGPFFLAGHELGFAAWEVQRAWQSLLLIVAFLGMRELLRRLGIGTPTIRLLGGALFALSPLIISEIGPLSNQALTQCLAPWVLAPLVGPGALQRPRRAATWSGIALLCAGGINATATIADLVLPALWLLMMDPGALRRRLVRWWLAAVITATAWWALPLLILGRYSPPFTNWIESGSTTTSTTNLFSVLSGTENWVGHLSSLNGPVWRAAWELATNSSSIVDTAALVALGLLGLTRPALPHRRFLLAATVLGVAILSFGHAGPTSAGFAGHERALLDGPLQAFRNLQKFDMVLRVPVVVAATYLAGELTRVSAMPAVRLPKWGRAALERPFAILVVLGLMGALTPILSHELEPAGAFSAIPSWWPQTANWLAAHDNGTKALLLPDSSHGDYFWGLPQDEPLQALATSPWAVRGAAPLGGAGEARLLDAVDEQVASGQASLGLAPYLARAGVGYVVIRNDLNANSEQITSTAAVDAAVQRSPGLRMVASFGLVLGDSGTPKRVFDDGVSVSQPAIEIYAVDGALPKVSTTPIANTEVVSGNVESLLPLATAGELSPAAATVMPESQSLEGLPLAQASQVRTDGNRRAEVNFGRVTNIYSATLLPQQPWSQERGGHDYDTGPTAGHQTTAVEYGGTVRASSSAADAAATGAFTQAGYAAAAFDVDPLQAWVSGASTAVGQWVELDLPKPSSPQAITIAAPAGYDQATRVRVTTDGGSEVVGVGPAAKTYALPAGVTSRVRLTVEAVEGGGPGIATSLKASVSGVQLERGLRLPEDLPTPSAPATYAFSAAPQNDGCLALVTPDQTVCSPTLVTRGEDDTVIDRTFSVPVKSAYSLVIAGVARGDVGLDAVMPHPDGLTVGVSSRAVDTAADGPEAMVDGTLATGWRASAADQAPAITVVLGRQRTVKALSLRSAPGFAAARPTSVQVTAADGTEASAQVTPNGEALLSHPLTSRRFVIRLVTWTNRADILQDRIVPLTVGVGELQLQFSDGATSSTIDPHAPFLVSCGSGPQVIIDGRVLSTEVVGDAEEAFAGDPVSVVPCGNAVGPVTLTVGLHRIRIAGSPSIRVTSVVLPGSPAANEAAARVLSVTQWDPDHRVVEIGPGSASWLSTTENENAGWTATLGGHRLRAVTLDGWKQGFLVPAGKGGTIVLQYGPNRPYRLSLLVGALLAALLLVSAAVKGKRRDLAQTSPRQHRNVSRVGGVAALIVVPVLVGGWTGVIVLVVVGVIATIGCRSEQPGAPLLGLIAAGTMIFAGLIASVAPMGRVLDGDGPGRVVGVLGLFALSAVTFSALNVTYRRSRQDG